MISDWTLGTLMSDWLLGTMMMSDWLLGTFSGGQKREKYVFKNICMHVVRASVMILAVV